MTEPLEPPKLSGVSRFTSEELDVLLAEVRKNLGNATPLNDVIFKRILGEPGEAEGRLMSLINAVREQTEMPLITEVAIESSTNYPQEFVDKITFLDIKAKDTLGILYNIEVQLVRRHQFVSRVVYYLCRLHGSQLNKGEGYSKIRPTISIILTDFTLFEELPGPFQGFQLTSTTNTDYVLTNDLQIYFVQFGKDLMPESVSGLVRSLSDWISLLNFPRTQEIEMKKVLQENPAIADAMNALSEFVADPSSRRYVEDTEKHRRDYEWAMECATQEGLAEGREEGHDAGFAEGREEGRTWGIAFGEARGSKEKSQEIARSLLREGLDVAFIARTTGLSVEEIEKLPE